MIRCYAAIGMLCLVLIASAQPTSRLDQSSPHKPEAPPDPIITRMARFDDHANLRYLILEPRTAMPEEGYGLVLILPGGDGSIAFAPFVQRLVEHTVPDDCIAVQLIAPQWTDAQTTVWPTSWLPAEGMDVPVEAFITGVVAEMSQAFTINPRRVHALGWSSAGPAVYAAWAMPDSPLVGAYVSMSVYRSAWMPTDTDVATKALWIDHSPDDEICPYRLAESAAQTFQDAGAQVTLTDYSGGHGWHDQPFARAAAAFAWLDEQATASDEPHPPQAAP